MPTDAPRRQIPAARPLTMAYVPGVTPGKWIGRWNERQGRELHSYQCMEGAALADLRAGRADLVFVRIPEEGFNRPAGVSVISLYEERPVVAAAKDHPVAAFDELDAADLSDEFLLDVLELGGVDVGMEVVASGSGVLVLPMAVAKLYSRRDVVTRPLTGTPGTRIAVAWLEGSEDEDAGIEEFVGIVRGRTANSSRQPSVQTEQKSTARQRTKERQSRSGDKAAAKPIRRSAAKGSAGSKGKGRGKGGKPRGR